MAMENKRIIQLNTERTTPAADDYVMVDSATAGTAKYLLPKITDAIDQEISDRTSADTTLQTAIDNEATARANADTTLQGNITAEATTRAAADNAINGEISQLKEDLLDTNTAVFEQGNFALADGSLQNSSNRCRTERFPLPQGTSFTIVPNGMDYNFAIYKADGTYSAYKNAWTGDNTTATFKYDYDAEIIVQVRLSTNVNITPSDVTTVVYYNSSKITQIQDELDAEIERSKTADIFLEKGTYGAFPTGGWELGTIAPDGTVSSVTHTMVTVDVQTADADCVLVTDWTKYRMAIWTLASGTWHDSGWIYADEQISEGTVFRLMIRGLTTHDFTEAEQAEIAKVTYYSYGGEVKERLDKLQAEVVAPPSNKGDFIVVSHQGYPTGGRTLGYNLLSGYPIARQKGFDWSECDIELSSDNVPVCCHDATFVDATTGNTITISEHTAAELKTYDYYGETIATFDEIMKCCKENGLGLQLDHITPSKMQYVTPIIKKYGMERRVLYLVGYTAVDPTYSPRLVSAIQEFDENAYIMIMANPTTITAVIELANTLVTNYNKVDITINYTLFSVADIISYLATMNARVNFSTYVIDDVATAQEYLPYVTSMTSNKISGYDIFTA